MLSKQVRLIPLALMAILIMIACNLPGQALTPPTPTDSINTKVAATLNAQLTDIALRITPTGLSLPIASATPTSETIQSPLPSFTLAPSSTPLPSFTPLPTHTASPSPTRTVQSATTPNTAIPGSGGSGTGPCNAAQFLKDVTVPDGTEFSQGETFTKTWRIKNVGYCTWSTSYRGLDDPGSWAAITPTFDGNASVVHGDLNGYVYAHDTNLTQRDGSMAEWQFVTVTHNYGDVGAGERMLQRVDIQYENSVAVAVAGTAMSVPGLSNEGSGGSAESGEIASINLDRGQTGQMAFEYAHFKVTGDHHRISMAGVGQVKIHAIGLEVQMLEGRYRRVES